MARYHDTKIQKEQSWTSRSHGPQSLLESQEMVENIKSIHLKELDRLRAFRTPKRIFSPNIGTIGHSEALRLLWKLIIPENQQALFERVTERSYMNRCIGCKHAERASIPHSVA